MPKVRISVSEELVGFFRFTGDACAHEETADLDETLKKIAEFNEKNSKRPFDSAKLLRDCAVMSRSREPSTADTQVSDIDRLRLEQEERKYQASVRAFVKPGNISEEVKEMRETYLLVSNFFLSFIGSFLFGFFSTQLFLNWRFEFCVFAGVFSAVFVLGVEAVLFIIRDEKLRKKKL